MPTTYRAVMLTKKGGPEALDIVELPVEAPAQLNFACGSPAPLGAWGRPLYNCCVERA